MQQSLRFKRLTPPTDCVAPRSTCHQAFWSSPVWEIEPAKYEPLVLPSTALAAGASNAVEDWAAALP